MNNEHTDPIFNLFGLKLPWKSTLAVVISTTLVLMDYYYRFAGKFLPDDTYADILRNKVIDRTGLYFVIPVLVILLVYREPLSQFGLTLGDWRAGWKLTLFAWAVATPIIYFSARTDAMGAYYIPRYGDYTPLELGGIVFLDLFGWEFVFRGFLLFALYRVAGPVAVVVQAVPFAMGHIGKPALETLSTIFGGTFFGWVAWRTRSFIFAFLIHYFILLLTIIVALNAGG